MKNLIGIEEDKAAELAHGLNRLLADYQVHYQNLRGFHWNIQGSSFFELHLKFEELYTAAQLTIDELAERILTLGHTPLHTFSDYLAAATLREAKNVKTAKETVAGVLSDLSAIITQERALLALANDAADEGTTTLLSDKLILQEKVAWMLAAYNKGA